MVSSGNGTVGAEKLTEEVFNIVQRVPELVKNLTGVDISKVQYAQKNDSRLYARHKNIE